MQSSTPKAPWSYGIAWRRVSFGEQKKRLFQRVARDPWLHWAQEIAACGPWAPNHNGPSKHHPADLEDPRKKQLVLGCVFFLFASPVKQRVLGCCLFLRFLRGSSICLRTFIHFPLLVGNLSLLEPFSFFPGG